VGRADEQVFREGLKSCARASALRNERFGPGPEERSSKAKEHKEGIAFLRQSLYYSCAFLFPPHFLLLWAKHSRNLTSFGFSLFCPCFASLNLPQAALGSALTEEKKAAKDNSITNIQSL
jgi:hypothetical protein